MYKTLKNSHEVLVHPSSLLFKEPPEWVVYHELVMTSKEYMRTLCEIKGEWLTEIAPHYFSESALKQMPKTLKPDLSKF